MNRAQRNALRLALIVAGLVALVWTVHSLGPRELLRVATQADPVWLGLSVLPLVARFLIWGWKWRRMLIRHRPAPFGLAVRAIVAGSFVNLTTPTAKLAGGFVRAAMLHRRLGWRMSTAYGWAFADQVTNAIGHMLLFGVGGLAFSMHPAAGSLRPAFAIVGGLTLGAVGLAVVLRRPGGRWLADPALAERLGRLIPRRLQKGRQVTTDALARVFGPLVLEGASWRTFVPDVLLGAVAFSTLPLANAMVLRSLGVKTPLLVVTVVVVLGYLAGNLLGPWGGIGVTEAALAALGTQFGVPPEQAATGALLHRGVYYLVVLIWGGLALSIEGRLENGS